MTKYRLVFESDFQPEWEAFVLECRKQGTTPDKQIETLVADFNRPEETSSSSAKKAAPKATPLSEAITGGTEPKASSPEPSKKTGTRSAAKKKKVTPPALKTTKRDKRPIAPKSRESGPDRPKGKLKRKVSKAPKAGGGSRIPDLPSLEPDALPSKGTVRSQLSSPPPLDPEGSGPPLTAPRRTKLRRRAAVQIPSQVSPKYQLLELMRQLDVERNGLEREELISEARSNAIKSPEHNLNKLIRRGLVHVYEGRCRTA